MRPVIRMKRKHALAAVFLTCSAVSFLLGFSAHAETREADRYRKGDGLQVETGLSDGFETMGFTCLDSDYQGGYLFVADEVIPYALSVRYGLADNDYGTSDVRTWLNQYFADTLSVTEELTAVNLPETGDSVSDKVFCLSIDEVKNPVYKEIVRKVWTPRRGMRYYWTRSKRENTTNQAYLVQYNGHIASSRVSLTEAGIRPAFVLGREKADTGQGKIWYEGDTQERMIHGKSYTFRCVDPNYCDAGMNRAGALFLCDSIIGGDESVFDENHNGWEASDLRGWLKEGLADSEGIARAETTAGYTYAGKSSDYMISERKFTKRRQPGNKTEDMLFCLSLEEAIRYGKYLWKLDGSETDNFNLAGSHVMGYWLRTPAARDGKLCYAVTYDGRVAPEQVDNDRIGNRPAFVAVQE
ncbi:hypothetical protein D7X87_10385 [bacterium D16-54]|nr:hypothetical protein D7X87_10385 [bacterium D16-54]RKJ14568.1 hypothetical protein D7X65_10980 [bacterium D16-56]